LIFRLTVGRQLGHSIEDFVNPEALLAAANRLGATYTENWNPIGRRELPSIGRAKALEQAFHDRGQERFSKVDLAYAFVDIIDETGAPACDQRRVPVLRELGNAVHEGLKPRESS
jgi:hypothetical protein